MPWYQINGTHVHVRESKPRRHRCVGTEGGHACPTRATRQCDFPLGKGRTCDAYICASHATTAGPDLDHCPQHACQPAGLFSNLLTDIS